MSQNKLRTFYTIILTQTFSLIGSRISSLAVGIWVYEQTGNATPLALVAFFSVLPMVLASSLSGVLADRWDRRIVMVLSDAGQALGTLLLFFSFATNSFELWHLYAVSIIQSTFGVFQGPAFQASVTMLIPDDERDRANAIQQLTGPAASVFAPAIAAFIYAVIDVEGAILVDLFTFIVAMIVIFSVRIPRPEETEEGRKLKGSILKEMMGGLTYLWERKPLFLTVCYLSMVNFLIAGASLLNTPYILARTNNNEFALGVIISLMNLGGILGAITLGQRKNIQRRMPTIIYGLIITSSAIMFAGMAQNMYVLGINMIIVMIPLPVINALFMSIIQRKVAPDVQGRVFSVLSQMSMLLTPISYLLIGPLADKVFEPAIGAAGWSTVAPFVGDSQGAGMGLLITCAGFFTLIITLAVYSIPAMRNIETALPDHVIQPEMELEAQPALS